MAFLSPIFLIGALAAAIPVLVHLVRRTRAQKLEFASLMFLRRIEQKSIRKRHLRNLLLLALRCAAILLLALSFSRPYFTSANPTPDRADRPASVILLDVSYSMAYGDVFDRARQAARNIIADADANEQVAVVLFSESYQILAPLKASRTEAEALINQAQPGLGSTDYLQALQAADGILKEATGGRRRIYLISDMQNVGWNRAAPPVRLARGVEVVPVDVSRPQATNLALAEVKAEPVVYSQKYPGKLIAGVANFSAEAVSDVTVELKLNDLTVERRPLKLEAGQSANIEFSDFNVPDGSNRGTIEVSGDGFQLDNKRFFTVRRQDQTRVLTVDTAVRGRPESFYLQQSLLAGENTQYSLAVKTSGTVNPADIDSYRVVIVNDVAGVNEGLATAVREFVSRGGGLVLVAGRHTNAAEFNRVFGPIAPAVLGETVQGRGGFALMTQVKTDHPIFSLLARSGPLASTRVFGYHRAVAAERASVIAALDEGSPVIVEGTAGSGKVLLVTTTLDTAWNDLPLAPTFLPLVRQMLDYLAGHSVATPYTVGQVFAVPPDADGSLAVVLSPGGARVEEQKTTSGDLAVTASEIGFYRLRYRNRTEHAAVNLDARESDLTKLNIDDLIASTSPDGAGSGQPLEGDDRPTPEQIEARQRLWLPLLIAALGLFVAEAVLARRIRIAKLIG